MNSFFKKSSSSKSTFYCFTPEVSLATFLIEFALAAYVLIKYRLNEFSRIVVFVLLLLGAFQFSEFMMCKTDDLTFWAKVGAISITYLPVMTLHLATCLTRKTIWTKIGYIVGTGIIGLILFTPALTNIHCTGFFVAIDMHDWFSVLFDSYYTIFLILTFWFLFHFLITKRGDKKALLWSKAALLSFVLPAVVISILIVTTRNGVASIMCGFAISAALIIVFKVLPRVHELEKEEK